MHTPFFPAFRPRLAALGRRVQHLRQQSLCHLELTARTLSCPRACSPRPMKAPTAASASLACAAPSLAFSTKCSSPRPPAAKSSAKSRPSLPSTAKGAVDENTSAYCQARKRLPLDTLCRVRVGVAAAGEKMAELWHGLRPKLIDGTTVSAPDTRKNQRAYPQSRSQKPGCGFPLIRLVGVFSLATGVLLDYAKGNKHHHELRLLWKLLDSFKPGDLAVADRGFCSYVLLALLLLRGVASSVPPASAPADRFAPRPAPGQKRPALHLAQAAPEAPLAAPVLVEEDSRPTDRAGDSLQTVQPGLSARIGYAGDHAAGRPEISRPGHRPTLRPALENRTVVSRPQNFDGHGGSALQESRDAAQRIGDVLHRL